jgi:hypothetical protein
VTKVSRFTDLRAQLELEVEAYNELLERLAADERDRLRRAGRIEVLQELAQLARNEADDPPADEEAA